MTFHKHKIGDLVRLYQHTDPHQTLYEIVSITSGTQFPYVIREWKTKKRPGGMWQEYQLVAPDPEIEPEFYL